MPTILRFGSMRFQIYVDDHEPPHVHVDLPDGEVVIILLEVTQSVAVRKAWGSVRARDIARVEAIATEHFETLLMEWSRYHR